MSAAFANRMDGLLVPSPRVLRPSMCIRNYRSLCLGVVWRSCHNQHVPAADYTRVDVYTGVAASSTALDGDDDGDNDDFVMIW